MFGTDLAAPQLVVLLAQIAVTVFLIRANNPHPKGSKEHLGLALARTGMGLAVWSFGFGLVGLLLALGGFVLSLVAIIKGEIRAGVLALVLCALLPALGVVL